MRGKELVTLEDFSKGLSLTGNKWNTPSDVAYDCRDVEPLGHFGLRRRQPTFAFTTTAASDNLDYLIYGQADDLIYSGMPSTTVGKIYTCGSGGGSLSAVGATLANFGAPLFAIEGPTVGGQGPIFWVGQTGASDTSASAYFYSSSSARGTWTGPPAGRVRAMVYHGNRVWLAIGTSLYFSDIGDPTSWPAGNVVQFEPWASGTLGSTGSITALVPCGANLLVFKVSKSWVVYDLDTGANRTLAKIGCETARACVQDVEGSVYFSGGSGIYHTDGSTVQEAVNGLGYSPVVSVGTMTSTGGRYVLCFMGDAVYVYDTRLRSWFFHRLNYHGSPSIRGGSAFAAIGYPQMIFIPTYTSTGLQSWRPDHSGADNDTDVFADIFGDGPDFVWSGGVLELDKQLATKKRLREVEVVGGGADSFTTIGQTVNFGSAWAGASTRKRLSNFGVSREWNLTMSGTPNTDPNQRVLSVTMAFIPRKN